MVDNKVFCMKEAKKWGAGDDCFIYAIDDKIVWNFDGSEKSSEITEAKATYEAVLKEEDKKEETVSEEKAATEENKTE